MLLRFRKQVMLWRVYFEMFHGTFLLFHIHTEQFSVDFFEPTYILPPSETNFWVDLFDSGIIKFCIILTSSSNTLLCLQVYLS